MRRTTAAVMGAALVGAGTLTALIASSTSVTAASPKAGITTSPPAAPTQTIGTEAVSSSVSVRSYDYGSHERNNLDVFAPTSVINASSEVRRPAVVLVHGGSWVKGDKSAMHGAARAMVGEGYVAIPVNYRYATQAAWPAQREDVQDAIGFVRKNAAELHVDTSKIVVLGSSAGGEIAASALTEGNGSKLARGLVSLSAPLDLGVVAANTTRSHASGTLAKIVTEQLLRCLPSACADVFRKSSAAYRHDSKDPASLIITSGREWVDPNSSRLFHQAALQDGVASDLYVIRGEEHGMDYWDRAWPTIRRWIDARMDAKR